MSIIRRSFSSTFKAEVALQALREYNLNLDIVVHWKQSVEEYAKEIFDTDAKSNHTEDRMFGRSVGNGVGSGKKTLTHFALQTSLIGHKVIEG